MISFALIINSAKALPCFMLHVESPFTSIGIANLECAVLPPGISKAAMPLDATVKTISPLDLKAAEIALQMKVLPVPP